jgi:hypothetical protein
VTRHDEGVDGRDATQACRIPVLPVHWITRG